MAGSSATSATSSAVRRYQRGWSNTRMKVRGRGASGSPQRKGTLETFWVTWLVTASSITEPIAESASHSSCSFSETDPAAERGEAFASGSNPFIDIHAVPAQRSANTAKRSDQPQPSWLRSNSGSNSTGKPSSARSEAKLESANRGDGPAPRKRRQYQDCSGGVVVESRKYGRPIVATSRTRMREIGSSSPRGFQPLEAMIGRQARGAARSATSSTGRRPAPPPRVPAG